MKGKNNSQGSDNASEEVNAVVKMLKILNKWIDEIPPIQQPQRFGNQAFRTWYDKLKTVSKFIIFRHISIFECIFLGSYNTDSTNTTRTSPQSSSRNYAVFNRRFWEFHKN